MRHLCHKFYSTINTEGIFKRIHYQIVLSCVVLLTICLALIPSSVGGQTKTDNLLGASFSLLNIREIDYNRVEGFYLGNNLTFLYSRLPQTSLTLRGGYGFKSKKWRYALMINHAFDPLSRTAFTFTYFDETRTNDQWILPKAENVLSAILLKKDYRDYFRLRGVEAHFMHKYGENLSIAYEFGYRRYNSMPKKAHWSLFKKDKEFRQNPAVTEDEEILLSWTINYSTLEDMYVETSNWQLGVVFERELYDFGFTGAHFLIQRTQISYGNQTLIAGLRGGYRDGTVSEQYLMDLGGIGSLRGYQFKEFTGNRRIFFECNYLFNGDLLQSIPIQAIPLYSSLESGVFFEAGLAWINKKDRKLLPPGGIPSGSLETGSRLRDIKSDIGVSLFILDGAARIDFARRLDRKKDPWKITFRLRLLQDL